MLKIISTDKQQVKPMPPFKARANQRERGGERGLFLNFIRRFAGEVQAVEEERNRVL